MKARIQRISDNPRTGKKEFHLTDGSTREYEPSQTVTLANGTSKRASLLSCNDELN